MLCGGGSAGRGQELGIRGEMMVAWTGMIVVEMDFIFGDRTEQACWWTVCEWGRE